jgi:hypothetical protein
MEKSIEVLIGWQGSRPSQPLSFTGGGREDASSGSRTG